MGCAAGARRWAAAASAAALGVSLLGGCTSDTRGENESAAAAVERIGAAHDCTLKRLSSYRGVVARRVRSDGYVQVSYLRPDELRGGRGQRPSGWVVIMWCLA